MTNLFMAEAIQEAYTGIQNGHGGPFGAVIVKNGQIVGRGHNQVLALHDPTAHGEIIAIRDACQQLNSHDLTGAELYTTAEPCPMCLGAILWANIKTVYYGCNRVDSETIGFRDNLFYQFLGDKQSLITVKELDRDSCLKLFEDYARNPKHQRY